MHRRTGQLRYQYFSMNFGHAATQAAVSIGDWVNDLHMWPWYQIAIDDAIEQDSQQARSQLQYLDGERIIVRLEIILRNLSSNVEAERISGFRSRHSPVGFRYTAGIAPPLPYIRDQRAFSQLYLRCVRRVGASTAIWAQPRRLEAWYNLAGGHLENQTHVTILRAHLQDATGRAIAAHLAAELEVHGYDINSESVRTFIRNNTPRGRLVRSEQQVTLQVRPTVAAQATDPSGGSSQRSEQTAVERSREEGSAEEERERHRERSPPPQSPRFIRWLRRRQNGREHGSGS